MYFSSAYAQASWTVPSHASLLSSRYAASHGAGGSPTTLEFRSPRPAPDLVSQLRAHGYAADAYANTPYFDGRFGLTAHFDRAFVLPPVTDPLPSAADWLLATASAPFVFAHTYAVHNYADLQDGLPRRPDGRWRCPAVVDPFKRGSFALMRGRSALSCAESRARYDRAAWCFDEALDRFVTRLKAEGLWDRALVAIVADHGESLCDGAAGRGARKGHGQLGHEEQLRVPWVLKLPGGRFGGRRVETPVELIDAAPTILAALGLPAPESFQGRDRMPEAAGAPGDPAAPVFAETDGGFAVRAGGWKLLWSPSTGWRLHDLTRDPGETRDLSRKQEGKRLELTAALHDHLARQHGPWKVRVRGPRGRDTRLRLSFDAPIVHAAPVFHEKGDGVSVATDAVNATFVSQRDGDEDWLLVETSTPSTRATLLVEIDGAPADASLIHTARGDAAGPQPWTVPPGADAAAAPSAPRDGVTVWGLLDATPVTRRIELPPALREALRRAGYAP
ncbi:MAG: sulfatase-like hydrolase/transferase [Elusimicrobiota bacterium]|nr:sulfatase-like hydrolase/transferase [Elusimicrobiota bacterium]